MQPLISPGDWIVPIDRQASAVMVFGVTPDTLSAIHVAGPMRGRVKHYPLTAVDDAILAGRAAIMTPVAYAAHLMAPHGDHARM